MKAIITCLVLLAVLASCDSNDSRIKYSYSFNDDGDIKREMITKNAQNDIEIEMEGNASFNADGTAITGLTKNGRINYRNKDITLTAAQTKNNISIAITKNGRTISETSDTGKEITAEAIRDIKKLQDKYK